MYTPTSHPAVPTPGRTSILLAAALLLLTALPLSWIQWRWGPPGWQAALADLLYVPTFLGAAGVILWVAGRHAGRERLAWTCAGLGTLSFGLGQVVWAYVELVQGRSPFPSAADALFLLFSPLFTAALLLLPRGESAPLQRARRRLDVAIIVAAAALYSWRFLLSGIMHDYAGRPLTAAIVLAYPVSDLVLLALLLRASLRGGQRLQAHGALLALGLLSFIVADTGFTLLNAQSSGYQGGDYTDAYWTLGGLMFGLSALSSLGPWRRLSLRVPAGAWLALGLPYLALAACFALLMFSPLVAEAGRGVLLGTALVTALVVGRQLIAFAENARLTGRLRALSVQLEDRVRDRTAELRVLSETLEARVLERTAQLEASQAQLAHQVQHDALTGLPNRLLFEDRLARAVAASARGQDLLAVLFVDLDGFKLVNDLHGHAQGDALLRAAAGRLAAALRDGDTVARLGGDEFVALVPGLHSARDAQVIARKLVRALAEPFTLDAPAVQLSLSASIGVSLYPQDGLDAPALLQRADIAMYQTKQQGKNGARFYSPEMNVVATERLRLEAHMRGALARGEFELHYQPQYGQLQYGQPCGERVAQAAEPQLVGFEALLRWHSPDLGPVTPAQFIPVAEDTGMIHELGAWVLAEAAGQLRAWQDAGLNCAGLRMAVNVSPLQFERADFVQDVRVALDAAGLHGAQLEIELTAGLIVRDLPDAARKMRQLRAQGVSVAIDDFGAGHSALNYLLRLPVSTLKIDRAFMRDLSGVPGAGRVMQAIVALAHALEMDVVAEGIETETQLRAVRDLGCDRVQGYLLGRPEPAVAARQRLARAGWPPGPPAW